MIWNPVGFFSVFENPNQNVQVGHNSVDFTYIFSLKRKFRSNKSTKVVSCHLKFYTNNSWMSWIFLFFSLLIFFTVCVKWEKTCYVIIVANKIEYITIHDDEAFVVADDKLSISSWLSSHSRPSAGNPRWSRWWRWQYTVGQRVGADNHRRSRWRRHIVDPVKKTLLTSKGVF